MSFAGIYSVSHHTRELTRPPFSRTSPMGGFRASKATPSNSLLRCRHLLNTGIPAQLQRDTSASRVAFLDSAYPEGPTDGGRHHEGLVPSMASSTHIPILCPSISPPKIMLQPWVENLTGTRGAYKPYNTVAPKIIAWEPKTTSRS